MVVTSEALGTCERLVQGRYSTMRRPGSNPRPVDCKSSALTATLLEARWTSDERETQKHKKTKPGERNRGQRDELETGGSCWTRQTRMATFAPLGVKRFKSSQVSHPAIRITHKAKQHKLPGTGNECCTVLECGKDFALQSVL